MNRGAFIYSANFLDESEVASALALADAMESQRTAVHEAGKYAGTR